MSTTPSDDAPQAQADTRQTSSPTAGSQTAQEAAAPAGVPAPDTAASDSAPSQPHTSHQPPAPATTPVTAPSSQPRSASPLTLAAVAAVAVPGLDPARLATPQQETDTLRTTGVIDTQGRHWEVIQALTDPEGAALDAESEVLRRLGAQHDAGAISFDVPRPAGSVRTRDIHVQVRTHADGRPLTLSSLHPGPGLSAGLGRALGELHELPHSVVAEAGLPVYDADDVHEQWRTMLTEAEATGRVPSELLTRWRQVLDTTAIWRFRPCVVHGDLAEENILTAGGAITAMRGCAQMHVGDPAEDLAWVYSTAPVDCLDSIDAAYDLARTEGVDKHIRERAELVSEMSLVRWLLHGVRTHDEAVMADACAMLDDLLTQVAGQRLAEEPEPVLAAVPAPAPGAPVEDEAVEPSQEAATGPVPGVGSAARSGAGVGSSERAGAGVGSYTPGDDVATAPVPQLKPTLSVVEADAAASAPHGDDDHPDPHDRPAPHADDSHPAGA